MARSMKAITPVIATIVLLLITVAIAGSAWTYISGYWTGTTGKQIEVTDAFCVGTNQAKILVKNIGTGTLSMGDITILNTSNGKDLTHEVEWSRSAADSGLVLELMLDEGSGTTASDASKNDNTFTIGAVGSNVIWDNGKNGWALNYLPSAKTAAAPCPTGAFKVGITSSNEIYNLPQSTFTFVAWLKITAAGGIVKFNTEYTIPGCCNGLWINTNVINIANSASANTPIGITIPADNSWHHFAYVFNRPVSTHQTYLDGNLFQSQSNLAGSYGHISVVNLGIYDASWCGAGHAMTGIIDEVRMYNRALLPEEIKALADDAITLPPGETATITHKCNERCDYRLVMSGLSKTVSVQC